MRERTKATSAAVVNLVALPKGAGAVARGHRVSHQEISASHGGGCPRKGDQRLVTSAHQCYVHFRSKSLMGRQADRRGGPPTSPLGQKQAHVPLRLYVDRKVSHQRLFRALLEG